MDGRKGCNNLSDDALFIHLVDFVDALLVKSCWLFDAINLMQDGQTLTVIVYQWS